MGATLQLADEKHGYTLTDRATYLTWRDKLQLFPMVEGDSLLYNVYHVLERNPKNASRINVVGGKALPTSRSLPRPRESTGDTARGVSARTRSYRERGKGPPRCR